MLEYLDSGVGGNLVLVLVQRRRHGVGINGGLLTGKDDVERLTEARGIGQHGGFGPVGGHGDGEGHQHQGVAHHGRVEGIGTQPAVELFGQHDGRDDGDGRDPPGRELGLRQAQQQTGDRGGIVFQEKAHRFAPEHQHGRLCAEGQKDAPDHVDQVAPAKEQGLRQQPGQSRQDHQQHDLRGGPCPAGVG